jgi:pyruvate dehydrogenase E2 component (dihydrolipoamide acetyltransferase)|tara:strand:- start:22662 stop:23909 length:1248 start_codon:yes stop_codon:yes gene_type:complete
MAEVVRMPKLSDTMTEGVVAEWHKKIGDDVESGEVLAEIETDKATMEFESFLDGVLLYIGIEKGQTAPVDAVLAILGQKGEDISALLAEVASEPVGESASSEPKVDPPQLSVAPVAAPSAAPAPIPVSVSQPSDNGRLKASPLAKALAADKGIDIQQIAGSGNGGRIVKRDIDNFTLAAAAQTSVATGVENYTEEPVSQMRKVIASRLSESKFTAPHFYLTMDIDMDNSMAARKQINAAGDVKISFNDFVVKAAANALKRNPKVNSAWMGDKIRYNNHIHIGIAVAVPDGLLVPVVRFADTKGLAEIGAEVKDLAGKAKAKKLQPNEWEGNTFTISNLGMYGIEAFTAIVNPPDACILAVGGIKQIPVVKNGQVLPGNVMKVTLSCDHRVVDGATGSEFLLDLKANLENPVRMLV